MLDEVLGLELSNFARLLKLRPGVDDDHLLVQQVADDLCFRQTKPHTNAWLYLSPGLCTLGEDAFEHAPAVIKEIHAHLKNLFNERELAGGMMFQLMQDVNTMSLDKFQADILATMAQCERSDAVLGGMGVGWTPSFLSTCYPRASRNLIASFVKDIRKLSIGLILALYENFVRGPANLFTQALADLRLDGLLTLNAMTYGRLGDLHVLLRYPEQLQGRVVNSTRSWKPPRSKILRTGGSFCSNISCNRTGASQERIKGRHMRVNANSTVACPC